MDIHTHADTGREHVWSAVDNNRLGEYAMTCVHCQTKAIVGVLVDKVGFPQKLAKPWYYVLDGHDYTATRELPPCKKPE